MRGPVGSKWSVLSEGRQTGETYGDSSLLLDLQSIQYLLVLRLSVGLVKRLLLERNRSSHLEHSIRQRTYERKG